MKRTLYVSAAVSVALVAGGPVAAAAAVSADAARTVPAATAARADVDAQGAAAAALKHYPGYVESLDQDGSVWHVNVIGKDGKGHAELEVNAASGAVTQRNQDHDEDSGEYKALIAAKVTADQAMKAALAAHPGQVRSLDWDDDDDNGRAPYWHVEIKATDGTTANVDVNATTAQVTPSHSDSNDNDENGNGNDNDGSDGS
ncbi:peptidase YpeB-like protein [Streptomyces sp. 3211.6]|uniref:PepSY domain-containing protein n=1 Tax=Streptomyces sp. 3211.6 TaxID=1938845 RepID=UPI000EAE03B4|nr:PepSY domain-containing protein [Streptomyces sp. 3211.6]RKT06954.1 peptidase YpeB-like protein [Streptomyces sp. 3211.6]